MRVLSVVHHRNAGAGVFADAVAEHELVEWLPHEAPPPRAGEFDAAIVLGAKAQVDEERAYPWLRDEKRFVRRLLRRGTPMLGVCFGAQLIAEAMGAVVRQAVAPERGWHPVELTAEGRRDPVLGFLPERFDSIQGHSYECLLPGGAVALARSATCLQAFRLARRPVWGVQFHPEVTEPDYNSWLDSWSDPEPVRAETAAKIGTWNDYWRGIAERFLAMAAVPHTTRTGQVIRSGLSAQRRLIGVARTRASDLVEQAYRTWNEHGPRAFIELTTEDVELHDPPELPDAQKWVGRDAAVARLEDVVATTGGTWADIDEVRPVGDEVLVSLTWRLEQGSPATLAAVFHVVAVEDDLIARVRVFLDEDAAVRAALGG